MPPPANLHVIFGSGQVGGFLARELTGRGLRVRVARRGEAKPSPGVELVRGDASDPDFCRRAAEGAAVVYHCMNPAYSTKLWAEQVPLFADNLVLAAGGAKARLVVLDNLYMVGPTGGKPIDEATPFAPVSKKGEIRKQAGLRFLEASAKKEARVVVARASDFYGPGGDATHFGPTFWQGALRGKPANLLIPPRAIHTYHYIPDVARALMALGTAEANVDGQTFMLPCAPAESAEALVVRFAEALGQPITTRVLPRWLLPVLGLFVPMLGEIREMLYQWDAPFIINDARFRARFPDFRPTPSADAAAATVAWAKQSFGKAKS